MYSAALPGEAEARLFSWQEQVFLTLLLVTNLEQIITAVSRWAHIQRGTMVRSMHGRGWKLLQGNYSYYHHQLLVNTSEQ